MASLAPVIKVIEEKCVNCHNCIAVCPVKWCIDGSGDKVTIIHDLCIGCGSCIEGCTHHAREGIDDTEAFFSALDRKEAIAAIVAPAIAGQLGKDFLRLNGWLKRQGVRGVFDVAFGAELTVKSYAEHIKTAKPKTVIAQPCPAIVSYVQIYQPSLSKWLAPADSPMLHTIKMLREWNPDLKACKIAVISPCVAKRREFDETGLGDYNVTIEKFMEALAERSIRLADSPEEDFDNPPAETAVLFSSPGGLKATVERDFPGLGPSIRRIEGPKAVYPYFRELEKSIASGQQPLVVDCLNCEKGCNGGTGTGSASMPVDQLEHAIAARRDLQQRRIAGPKPNPAKAAKAVRRNVDKRWKPGLYKRSYADHAASLVLKHPSDAEFKSIYAAMAKACEEDYLNCAACGYNSCEMMAVAIHNGLNKAENCHHYQKKNIEQSNERLKRTGIELDAEITRTAGMVGQLLDTLPRLEDKRSDQAERLQESASTIEELLATLVKTADLSGRGKEELDSLAKGVREGEASLGESIQAIRDASTQVGGIHELVDEIDKIASQTNLLSMNAAIEAAHAGDSGRGFAVVAEEIRRLSEQVSESAGKIGQTLRDLVAGITQAATLSDRAGGSVSDILGRVNDTAANLNEIYHSLAEMSSGTEKVNRALAALHDSAYGVKVSYEGMRGTITEVGQEIREISAISRSNVSGDS